MRDREKTESECVGHFSTHSQNPLSLSSHSLSLSIALFVSVGATFLLRLSHGNVRDALFAGFACVSWNAAPCNNGGLVLFDSFLVSKFRLFVLTLGLLASFFFLPFRSCSLLGVLLKEATFICFSVSFSFICCYGGRFLWPILVKMGFD